MYKVWLALCGFDIFFNFFLFIYLLFWLLPSRKTFIETHPIFSIFKKQLTKIHVIDIGDQCRL